MQSAYARDQRPKIRRFRYRRLARFESLTERLRHATRLPETRYLLDASEGYMRTISNREGLAA